MKFVEHFGYLKIANLGRQTEYRESVKALDDVTEWLGFTDVNWYLETLYVEGSEIFRRAS